MAAVRPDTAGGGSPGEALPPPASAVSGLGFRVTSSCDSVGVKGSGVGGPPVKGLSRSARAFAPLVSPVCVRLEGVLLLPLQKGLG